MKRITLSKTPDFRLLAIFHDEDAITAGPAVVMDEANLAYLVGDIFGIPKLSNKQMQMIQTLTQMDSFKDK